WRSPWWRSIQYIECCFDYTAVITADELVGSFGQRDWTLSVVSEGQARDAKNRCFFLNASGVGKHNAGLCFQGNKIKVTNSWNDVQLVRHSPCDQLLCRSWMGRQDERAYPRNLFEGG